MSTQATPLARYIRQHYGVQASFATVMNVYDSKVSLWVCKGWVVLRGRLYSPMRQLPAPPEGEPAQYAMQAVPVLEYTRQHYPGQSAFARHLSTSPSHIWYWVTGGWVIINQRLYAPRRRVPALRQTATTYQEEVTV